MDAPIVNWILGLLTLSIAGYTRAVSSRLEKTEKQLKDLNDKILESYHPKSEIREMVAEIKALLKDSIREVRDELRSLKETRDERH